MDECSQVARPTDLATHEATWLRDEEAGSSNLPTPTSSQARFPSWEAGLFVRAPLVRQEHR
jgi:hypothetical protein